MDKEGESSSHPSRAPHFFKIILPHTLQNGILEIPPRFVKEHGNYLSKYACLEVSTGATWKVELKRGEGRVWLHKGWQDFVEYYSIKYGYFLVFRYEGGSFFHVFIFDATALEIEYPATATSNTHKVKLDQSKVSQIKEEDEEDDDVSVEILDECLQKLHKRRKVEDNDEEEEEDDDDDFTLESPDECQQKLHKSRKVPLANQHRKLRTRQYSSCIRNNSEGDDQVIEEGRGLTATSARDRVLQRAKAFQSSNPHFIVAMKRTYTSYRSYLHIADSHARSYFLEKGSNGIYLKGADGRAWFVKYAVGVGSRDQVRLKSGWSQFARENHLQAGDACIFELINSTTVTYKVTILRVADEEEIDKNAPPEMLDVASNAKDEVLKRAEAFKSKNPHFVICMSPTYISFKGYMHVPRAHSRRHLKDSKQGKNVIVLNGSNGRTWSVLYYVTESDPDRARLGRGWKDFVLDNHLQVGDVCIFEMISGKAKAYKVTILCVADFAWGLHRCSIPSIMHEII